MSKSIVISQPMFLPWVGMFEQLNLSDVFVHYDDVQMPRGRSFTNRVQLKTKDGIKWLTVPIDRKNSGKLIKETLISYNRDWRDNHLNTIKHAFAKARYNSSVYAVIDEIYDHRFTTIDELNIFSFELIARKLGFDKRFLRSSGLSIDGVSSERLLRITKNLGGKKYITGLGALNYIDYNLFETDNISVEYMQYKLNPYSQLFSGFTPYVSILDLIANEGFQGKKYINSQSVYWRIFKDG